MRLLDFHQIQGRHCVTTALASYLYYMGWYEMDEAEMWLLSGGRPGLYYFSPLTAETPADFSKPGPFPRIRSDCAPLWLCLQENLSLTLEQYEEKNAQEAWKKTAASLDQNKPQIIEVDVFYLPPYTHYYKKRHWWHLLVVWGYDKTSVYVSDPDWQGKISVATLQSARNSTAYKHPIRGTINNRWWELRLTNGKPIDITRESYQRALQYAIECVLFATGNEADGYNGRKAEQKFINYINLCLQEANEAFLHAFMEEMFYQLSRPESVAHSFFLVSCILNKYNFSSESLVLAEHFSQLAKQWQKLSLLFLKGSKRKPHPTLKTIADRLPALWLEANTLLERLHAALPSY